MRQTVICATNRGVMIARILIRAAFLGAHHSRGDLPMIRNKSKFVMSKSTIVLEIGLLALQGAVFLAMDLTISSILTFVNAGAWFLVWHRNETQ